jgi:ankyrin repeat protein
MEIFNVEDAFEDDSHVTPMSEWDVDVFFLQKYALRGDLESIKKLLQSSRKPRKLVRATNYFHRTALHYAARGDHPKICELLLSLGAYVSARNENGWTPLHDAARLGHANITRLLIQHGAKVNAKNRFRSTPLHMACKHDHWECVKAFLEFSKKIDFMASNKIGRIPFHNALDCGKEGMAMDIFFAFPKKKMVLHSDVFSSNAFHFAAHSNMFSLMTHMLKIAPNGIEKKDGYRNYPLHFAAWKGNDTCIPLVFHDKYANLLNLEGQTPLHLTCTGGFLDATIVLLSYGCDPTIKDFRGRTPLRTCRDRDEESFTRVFGRFSRIPLLLSREESMSKATEKDK